MNHSNSELKKTCVDLESREFYSIAGMILKEEFRNYKEEYEIIGTYGTSPLRNLQDIYPRDRRGVCSKSSANDNARGIDGQRWLVVEKG